MAMLKLVENGDDYPKKIAGLYYIKKIPVQTFYVRDVSDELNEQSLGRYFSKYGTIDSIIIRYEQQTYRPNRNALITFKSAEAAARLLDEGTQHIVNHKNIKIKIADIWYQPICKTQKNSTLEPPEHVSDPKITILDLNDDCLLHIISYLSMRDQIEFSFVCERFRSVCGVIFKRNTSLVSTVGNKCIPNDIHKRLSAIGPYLEKVVLFFQFCPISNEWLLKLGKALYDNCKKLETLNLYYLVSDNEETIQKMLIKLTNLKSLSLKQCKITDSTCEVLPNLIRIESVNLSRNIKITGQYLDKLTNLTKLNISHTNIDRSYLLSIIKSKILKELNIINCENLNKENPKDFFIYLTELEVLSIDYCQFNFMFLNELIKLKNLKYLKIVYRYNIHSNMAKLENIEHLAIIDCAFNNNVKTSILLMKNLKCLEIIGAQDIDDLFLDAVATVAPLRKLRLSSIETLTQDGVINFIKKCPTIDEIDISCERYRYDNAFVFRVIDVMVEANRTKTLKLIVDSTNITKSIEKEEKFAQNKALVKLCFYAPYIHYHVGCII